MAILPGSLVDTYVGTFTSFLKKYSTLPRTPPVYVFPPWRVTADEIAAAQPIHELLWGRSFRVMPIQPLAVPEEPIRDDHANKPDDTLLPLDEWNAKVDAMIAEWVAMQTRGV